MNGYLYKDYDSLFEKFSIMSLQADMDDRKALEYLKNKTSPELFNCLLMTIKKN